MPSQKPQHHASASIRVWPSYSCSTNSGSNSFGATSNVTSTSFMKRMISWMMRSSLGVLELRRVLAVLAPDARQPLDRHDGFRADGDGRQIAVQRIHRHRVFRTAFGQQELV